MTLAFSKYQGTGNDFIIIDGREENFSLTNVVIKKLCDRKFGVGADGLMVLNKHADFDFIMTYFNADGNEGSMCGNGGRCILAFAKQIGFSKNKLHFLATDGLHDGEIISQEETVSLVKLKMVDVSQFEIYSNHYELETGSPHYVSFTKNLKSRDVYEDGKAIRNSGKFIKEGINVNFVEEFDDHLFIRTFERGVEDETLSCGTGVTAATLAYALKNDIKNKRIKINTLGGKLAVSFRKENNIFKDVWLEGPATFVFKGNITI